LAKGPGLYQKWGPVAQGKAIIDHIHPTLEKLIRDGGMVVGKDNIMDAYYTFTGGEQRWGLKNALVRARTKALWQNLQPALKATDAVVTVTDALKKFKGRATENQIFEGVAEVMNRKYGGLNWDKMGTTIGMRRLLRAVVLAPDWTLSNLMLGVSALKGGFHPLSPQTMFSSTPEGWAARQSLAKSVATFFVTLQGVNMMMTGHTTFQNEEGRWWSLELPWRSPDGRKLYADWLLPGELKDLLRVSLSATTGDIDAALGFMRAKLSPLASTAISTLTRTDYAGRPLFQPGMTPLEKTKSLVGAEVEKALPIPIGLSSFGSYMAGRTDPTQLVSSLLGAGAVGKGALVPASLWTTLPPFNKQDFLRSLSTTERDDFTQQLRTGRVTGNTGEKFRRYYQRYQYLAQQQRQTRPQEQRYLPPGVHRPRSPVPVQP
jgi:hypothetical protein